MKLTILSLLFLVSSLFGETESYHFINVPYGTFLYESPQLNKSIFIPSFSKIEILEESEQNQGFIFLYDKRKKVKYKTKIGYIPSAYIGTYNIIWKKESPDKSKSFEIISPYKNCDCNRYGGYIDSCFLEIISLKSNSLIKRIGNEKQGSCENHYWTRVNDWFNEEELLASAHGDGDAGSGGTWSFAEEKINWSTGKITTLYKVNQMNCLNPNAKEGYSILYQVNASNKIHILFDNKIYSAQTPIIEFSSFKFTLDEKIDAFDCKLDFKKLKPINSNSVILYKEAKNQITYDIDGMFRFYYKGKEIGAK